MPKRKHGKSLSRDDNQFSTAPVAAQSLAPYPKSTTASRIPSRKSARLQEIRQHVPLHASHVSHQKKKKSEASATLSEQLSVKRRRLPTVKVQAGAEALRQDPGNHIEYWTRYHEWPAGFADEPCTMSQQRDSENSKKRSRTSSYSQNVKDGTVPEQYTPAYERWIQQNGLIMDVFQGGDLISNQSKDSCNDLRKITRKTITPTIFSEPALAKVIRSCQGRNEGKVNRDITPLIVPPIIALDARAQRDLEHVTDEVNADWNVTYVLAGPQIRPDLAVGLVDSAFSQAEIDKLSNYASVDNWVKFTGNMYFPFLMCEVKCGQDGLNKADRQNMHSSSVALRAILRLEQEADKFRKQGQLNTLDGQILVFSVSHDEQDARVYGHFATIKANQWSYHRYSIQKYDLRNNDELIAIHNFVANVFDTHVSTHIQRIKGALKALPEPSTLPLSTSSVDDGAGSETNSQDRANVGDAVFKKPNPPMSKFLELQKLQLEQQRLESKQNQERLERLLEQQRLQMEQQRLQMEQQRLESKQNQERLERLLEQQLQMEQQRPENQRRE